MLFLRLKVFNVLSLIVAAKEWIPDFTYDSVQQLVRWHDEKLGHYKCDNNVVGVKGRLCVGNSLIVTCYAVLYGNLLRRQ